MCDRLRPALAALCALGATACAAHLTDSTSGGSGSFKLSASVATLAVWRGDPGSTVTLSLARNHFKGPVTLSVFTPAQGVAASLSPTSLSGSTASSTLTVTAASDAQGGLQPLLVTARGAGADSQTVVMQLTIVAPGVAVSKSGSGSGTVTSSPAGISCGGACSAGWYVGLNVTLTATPAAGSAFAGWSGACTDTAATCTLTLGRISGSVTATFNSTAPGFSLGVAPSLVSIPQGGSGSATVNVTRANGYAGPVDLAVSGAPGGLTVTPGPASVTGGSSTLSIAAPLSLAAGNYHLALTGAGAGVTRQSAAFNVQVTSAAGGTSDVSLSFAACDPIQVPIWLAVQNGSGAWTRVPAGANSTFTFPVGATGGIAYVRQSGTSYTTTVFYGSGAELTSIATGDPCQTEPQSGTKRVVGTIAHLNSPPFFATLSIGGADTTYQSPGGPAFALDGVPSGPRDLIAGAHGVPGADGLTPLQRLIIRRGVNYANNPTIPLIDLIGAESFVPLTHRALVNNLGANQQTVSESLITANGTSAAFYRDIGGLFQAGPGVLFYALPDSLLLPGDLHAVQVTATPAGTNPTAFRFLVMLLHSPIDPTVALGPPLATPAVSTAANTPYLRPRTRLQSQAEYGGAVSARYEQNGVSVDISATAAYFGGTPATWILDVPDLSGAGYDSTWGLVAGAGGIWEVDATAGNVLAFLGATPGDGSQIVGAAKVGTSSQTTGSRYGGSIQWLRRP